MQKPTSILLTQLNPAWNLYRKASHALNRSLRRATPRTETSPKLQPAVVSETTSTLFIGLKGSELKSSTKRISPESAIKLFETIEYGSKSNFCCIPHSTKNPISHEVTPFKEIILDISQFEIPTYTYKFTESGITINAYQAFDQDKYPLLYRVAQYQAHHPNVTVSLSGHSSSNDIICAAVEKAGITQVETSSLSQTTTPSIIRDPIQPPYVPSSLLLPPNSMPRPTNHRQTQFRFFLTTRKLCKKTLTGKSTSFEERFNRARILGIGVDYHSSDFNKFSQLDPDYLGTSNFKDQYLDKNPFCFDWENIKKSKEMFELLSTKQTSVKIIIDQCVENIFMRSLESGGDFWNGHPELVIDQKLLPFLENLALFILFQARKFNIKPEIYFVANLLPDDPLYQFFNRFDIEVKQTELSEI